MQLDRNQTGERTGKILKRIVSMEDFDILPSNPWATFDVYIWILKNDPLFKFLGMRVKKKKMHLVSYVRLRNLISPLKSPHKT